MRSKYNGVSLRKEQWAMFYVIDTGLSENTSLS